MRTEMIKMNIYDIKKNVIASLVMISAMYCKPESKTLECDVDVLNKRSHGKITCKQWLFFHPNTIHIYYIIIISIYKYY